MGTVSTIFNVTALSFSFLAILIAAVSARRQAVHARRANLITFVAQLGQRTRTPEFRKSQDYVMTELTRFNPDLGIYGLPESARDHVIRVGGFYQDLGILVITGVVDENMAAVMYYAGIKDTWKALKPFILGERKIRSLRGAGGMYGSFEHLAAYTESMSHQKLAEKLRRRSFPIIDLRPDLMANVITTAENSAGSAQPSEAV